MNFPEIVDIAFAGGRRVPQPRVRQHQEDHPMQTYKIMHGLWGMGQMMFKKFIVAVDGWTMFVTPTALV